MVSRSEEHTSELQSHSEISYAVFCLKKKKNTIRHLNEHDIIQPASASMFRDFQQTAKVEERDEVLSTAEFAPFFFFFNDTATTEIYTLSYTLSLHDALPI